MNKEQEAESQKLEELEEPGSVTKCLKCQIKCLKTDIWGSGLTCTRWTTVGSVSAESPSCQFPPSLEQTASHSAELSGTPPRSDPGSASDPRTPAGPGAGLNWDQEALQGSEEQEEPYGKWNAWRKQSKFCSWCCWTRECYHSQKHHLLGSLCVGAVPLTVTSPHLEQNQQNLWSMKHLRDP